MDTRKIEFEKWANSQLLELETYYSPRKGKTYYENKETFDSYEIWKASWKACKDKL